MSLYSKANHGYRVEKWIENVRGRPNQNVWSAASPFEAIQVDGSWKRDVLACQHRYCL